MRSGKYAHFERTGRELQIAVLRVERRYAHLRVACQTHTLMRREREFRKRGIIGVEHVAGKERGIDRAGYGSLSGCTISTLPAVR